MQILWDKVTNLVEQKDLGESFFHLPENRGRHHLPIALIHQEQEAENLSQARAARVPGVEKAHEHHLLKIKELRSHVSNACQTHPFICLLSFFDGTAV
jgi:hypothetical protein